MDTTALITGASSGIGKAFAHVFAQHGYRLVIVAEDAKGLSETAKELRNKYDVEVFELHKNLVEEHAAQQIYDELKRKNIEVDVLVNNAGVGQRELFHETEIEKDLYIIRLNVEALVRLTKLFLKDMVSRGRGKILNMASIAGFQPGPLMAVYHASKSFILSFSESIADELEGTGVTVTVVCPGPTATHFFERADMENARIVQDSNVMEPDEVAKTGYRALVNNERLIIPGVENKLRTFSRRFMSKARQAAINRKYYEEKQEA